MPGHKRGGNPNLHEPSPTTTASTARWAGKRPPGGRASGANLPTPVQGPPGIMAKAVALREAYAADLPPPGFRPYYRSVAVNAANVTALTVGQYFQAPLDAVPTGADRIIYDVRYVWLEDNTDPLDPNAFSAMQDFQAMNGTISLELVVDGISPVDLSQTLFDPATATQVNISGFTQLNTNLLLFGNSPSVMYAQQGQTINARFRLNRVPGNPPTSLMVQLLGYTAPHVNVQKIKDKTRTP